MPTNRDRVLKVRLTAWEKGEVERMAREAGLGASEYLRRVIFPKVEKVGVKALSVRLAKLKRGRMPKKAEPLATILITPESGNAVVTPGKAIIEVVEAEKPVGLKKGQRLCERCGRLGYAFCRPGCLSWE